MADSVYLSWLREQLENRGLQPVLGLPERGNLTSLKTNVIFADQRAHVQPDLLHSENHESVDESALVASLRACALHKDLQEGRRVLVEIARKGLLDKSIGIGNALINMYAKFGAVTNALLVFDQLSKRDVVSWNALIWGYSNSGYGDEALLCFDQMQYEGLGPNVITFICTLKACGIIKSVERGKDIHKIIISEGLLQKSNVLGTALVDMYIKCDVLAKAQQVFDELCVHDVVSWTSLISGYAQKGFNERAFYCFEQMQQDGIPPNAMTFACLLKVCGSTGAIEKGEEIHCNIVRRGLHGEDGVLETALVDMYVKCGALVKARQVFDEFPWQTRGSLVALILGYCQHGYGEDALELIEHVQQEGISDDGVTYLAILKACGNLGAVNKGTELHDDIINKGLLVKNIVLGTALVDMYNKCGELVKAQWVFDELPIRDVVSWNALIVGYVNLKFGEEAMNCFERMQCEGLFPNAVTYTCILKACGRIEEVEKGKDIHDKIIREGLLWKHNILSNALVDMYARCGAVTMAQQVFDRLPFHDAVCWNVLITAYCQHNQGEEALNCLEQMQFDGFAPDSITFACILKACGLIGAVDKGKHLHAEIVILDLLEKNRVLGTALVTMYAKCGALLKAQQAFDELPCRNPVSWNALITGYSQHGLSVEALQSFEGMRQEGSTPNAVTFLSVLNACSSTGLMDEGLMYFTRMSRSHGIKPNLEHYVRIVELFVQGGHFEKAMVVIGIMPGYKHLPLWFALLAGCQKCRNVQLASIAFEHLVQMHVNSMHAAASVQDDSDRIEAVRWKTEAWNHNIYSFSLRPHVQNFQISMQI